VDREYFVFDALNMPETHPARDEWGDLFLLTVQGNEKLGRLVITPHTSSGQVREMLKGNLPIRMLNISRCGRRQIDISHVPSFYQFEGLVVDKNVSTANLIGVLDYFAKKFLALIEKLDLGLIILDLQNRALKWILTVVFVTEKVVNYVKKDGLNWGVRVWFIQMF